MPNPERTSWEQERGPCGKTRSERKDIADEVMMLCSHWYSGDVECYSEGDGNLMGAQVRAEGRFALECFSRITLAAVLKTGVWQNKKGKGRNRRSITNNPSLTKNLG